MIFNPNKTDFNTDYQNIIWMYGAHIVPLAISLANIDEPEIIDGCTQVYNCTMEILEDMYNNPDEYYPESPRWYTNDYLIWLITGRKPIKHHYKNLMRYLQRINQFGFSYDEDSKTLSNDRYPRFCEYLEWLAQLAKNKKNNCGGYSDRLDFRLFNEKIILTFDDLVRPLPDKYKIYAEELHTYAISKSMKVEKKDPYTFRYLYKKLYTLELHNNPFRIEVSYRLDNGKYIHDQFDRFMQAVEKEPDRDELISYIKGGICVCTACGGIKKVNQRCGRWVDIQGARRLLSACHPAIGKFRRGTHNMVYIDYDIMMLKRMMDVRIKQVDDYLGEK